MKSGRGRCPQLQKAAVIGYGQDLSFQSLLIHALVLIEQMEKNRRRLCQPDPDRLFCLVLQAVFRSEPRDIIDRERRFGSLRKKTEFAGGRQRLPDQGGG